MYRFISTHHRTIISLMILLMTYIFVMQFLHTYPHGSGGLPRLLSYPGSIFIYIKFPNPCIRRHRTVRIQVIPGPIDFLPTRCHCSASGQIIPGLVDLLPTRCHCSTTSQVIPGTVDPLPTRRHRSASGHVIP